MVVNSAFGMLVLSISHYILTIVTITINTTSLNLGISVYTCEEEWGTGDIA
jgi:hypothetical protein